MQNDRMISVHFQGKPFNIRVIQVYAPTSNREEAEVEWFYEDLQDLLELTPKKDVLFIIGDWNAKLLFLLPDHLLFPPKNPVCRSRSNSYNQTMEQPTSSK